MTEEQAATMIELLKEILARLESMDRNIAIIERDTPRD
jgi:hypothetical protein